jgi:hypothetical protein
MTCTTRVLESGQGKNTRGNKKTCRGVQAAQAAPVQSPPTLGSLFLIDNIIMELMM